MVSIDEWEPPARVLTVILPPGMPLLSLNDRLHHAERAERVRNIRSAAAKAARAQIALYPGWEPIRKAEIRYIYHACDRRKRDSKSGNLALAGKSALDGLVDAGVLPGDDDDVIVRSINERGNDVEHASVLIIQVIEVR